jgi:hypothetical protein
MVSPEPVVPTRVIPTHIDFPPVADGICYKSGMATIAK